MMEEQTVGARKRRYDGMSHVIGETSFVDDIAVPGTLTVKALRSPVSKGRVRHIDITKALDVPGVIGVVTPADIPNNTFGLTPDQPALAEDIRFKGQALAAVAAVDRDAALEAVERMTADIEEQTPVFDPREAMKEGAPLVRPEGNVHQYGPTPFHRVSLGDVEKGLAQADRIISAQYFHPDLEHTPLETQTCLAVPDASGKVTVYTTSQSHHLHLGMVAGMFNPPEGTSLGRYTDGWAEKTGRSWREKGSLGNIHMIGGTAGGGFGGKTDIHAEPVTTLLALKTGRPCKWRWSREEEITCSTHRGAWHMEITDGVMNDGRIVARKITGIRDAGAFVSMNVFAAMKFTFFASGPYRIPNIQNDGYCVFTNKPPASAMRGFAVTPSSWAVEVHMNRIAAELGIDPFALRLKNALRCGDTLASKQVINDAAYIETLQALAVKCGIQLPDDLRNMTSD